MTPEEKLESLGLTLPPAPKPVGAYVPFVRTGNLVYISGQLPSRKGRVQYAGKVPTEISLAYAQQAAKLAALNALAIAADAAGGLSNVARVVRLGAFVDSAPGFTEQAKVANAASNLLVEVLGDTGRHARVAVGVNELPLNAAVELELLIEVAG
jgi:enamine deaminase RidA (YjgF/YER057c/UK114 family)